MSGNIPDIHVGNANLLLLAEILETADENHIARREPTYDQHAWRHPCGTPACAIGHWNAYKKRTLHLHQELCSKEFAMTVGSNDWAYLFGYMKAFPKTSQESAARIRAFVAQRSQANTEARHE